MDKVIKEKIGDICFSMKADDYLQLPQMTKIYHEIELEPDLMAKYKELKKEMVSEIDGRQVTAVTAAALANKLLQFTSGTLYTEDHSSAYAHSTKVEFLESFMEENSGPALVFYHYKTALEKLKEAFPYAEMLTDENIERWRDGKIKMMLAHPQSGGIGLNLQCNAGNVAQCVWYDLPWSSENYIQANARIYRQGQTKPVLIHHLIAKKTIDEKVVQVLEGKIDLQDALMESLSL
jgi:SNF2 family DNA or RNA helicase